MRRDPKARTTKRWAEVFSFTKNGNRWASRTDKFGSDKFSNLVNLKDGYAVADCINPREERVLKFVMPILYPKKPTWMTVTITNTVFGLLSGERPVCRGIILQDDVGKLVSGVENGKPTPIYPYLFHLYSINECLREDEALELKTARTMLQFDVTPEEGEHPESPRESPRESPWILKRSKSCRDGLRNQNGSLLIGLGKG